MPELNFLSSLNEYRYLLPFIWINNFLSYNDYLFLLSSKFSNELYISSIYFPFFLTRKETVNEHN